MNPNRFSSVAFCPCLHLVKKVEVKSLGSLPAAMHTASLNFTRRNRQREKEKHFLAFRFPPPPPLKRSSTATPASQWAPAAGRRWNAADAPASCRGACGETQIRSSSPSSWKQINHTSNCWDPGLQFCGDIIFLQFDIRRKSSSSFGSSPSKGGEKNNLKIGTLICFWGGGGGLLRL